MLKNIGGTKKLYLPIQEKGFEKICSACNSTTMTSDLYYTITPSPVGEILLVGTPKGLSGLYLATVTKPHKIPATAVRNDQHFAKIATQLEEYFAGKRTVFAVEFDLVGSEFQQTVWKELFRIPFGKVISYKELAARIGKPTACRAVGNANGKNPVSIIIPCHRVIASDGSLGGYGWGLDYKERLLQLEKVVL